MNLGGRLLLVALLAAWTAIVGWALLRLMPSALSRAEKAGWSFAVGVLLQAAFYGAFLLARTIPGPRKMGAAGLAVWAFSLWRRRPEFPRLVRGAPKSSGPLAAIAVAAAAVAISMLDLVARPMWTTDYIAIWGFKARTIFLSAGIPERLFRDAHTFWSHPEYPLLLPLSLASEAAFLRRFDDLALALFDTAFEIATLLVVYGFLSRTVSRLAACAAVLLSASAMALYRGANAGTAEIPFALGVVLLCTALLDLRENDRASRRTMLLIAALFCAATKQEGTLLIAIALLIEGGSAILGRRRLPALAALCLVFPAAAQLAATRALSGSGPHHDYELALLAPARCTEWAGRLGRVLEHLATREIPSAGIALAALLLFLLITRRSRADMLIPTLGLQVGAYAVLSSISAYDPIWSIESSFARITMTLLPALTLVLGARLGSTIETPTGER